MKHSRWRAVGPGLLFAGAATEYKMSRIYVAVPHSKTPLTPAALEDSHAEILFGRPRDVELWTVRMRRGLAGIEQWALTDDPDTSDEGAEKPDPFDFPETPVLGAERFDPVARQDAQAAIFDQGNGTLGILAQGQAGHTKEERLFLHSAGIG